MREVFGLQQDMCFGRIITSFSYREFSKSFITEKSILCQLVKFDIILAEKPPTVRRFSASSCGRHSTGAFGPFENLSLNGI